MWAMIYEESDPGMKAAYGEMLSMSLEYPEQKQWYIAWIIELHDGTRVGDLCFKGLSEGGMVEIGYGILPQFQGNGYATEAVRAMTAWAAAQPGVKSVEAETEAENAASQSVLKKAGFVPSGRNGEEGPRFILCEN